MLPKKRFTSIKKPHLLALHKVAYPIAKAMKSHIFAKEFIKPCVIDVSDIILGDGAARKLKQVALSNDTVCRRINDFSTDICNQLISDFMAYLLKILLQLDNLQIYPITVC